MPKELKEQTRLEMKRGAWHLATIEYKAKLDDWEMALHRKILREELPYEVHTGWDFDGDDPAGWFYNVAIYSEYKPGLAEQLFLLRLPVIGFPQDELIVNLMLLGLA